MFYYRLPLEITDMLWRLNKSQPEIGPTLVLEQQKRFEITWLNPGFVQDLP